MTLLTRKIDVDGIWLVGLVLAAKGIHHHRSSPGQSARTIDYEFRAIANAVYGRSIGLMISARL
jgi:hypothetical protein